MSFFYVLCVLNLFHDLCLLFRFHMLILALAFLIVYIIVIVCHRMCLCLCIITCSVVLLILHVISFMNQSWHHSNACITFMHSSDRTVTTTHIGFCDVSFMSLKVVFSLSFIICDACVTKIGSSPIPCHKRSSTTKTYFFIVNLMTIILSSLIYDAHLSS